MGLNLYPAPQNPLGFGNAGGNLDINWGMNNGSNLNMGVPVGGSVAGPAPAASAAPMTPTVGLSPTAGITVPDTVMTALDQARTGTTQAPVTAEGLGWSSMPFMDKAKTVMGGIGTLGQIWSAFQANKIARESLDFQKKAFKENLTNQRSSYNMALEDRANARYAQMGRPDDAAAYIEKHRLGG